MALCVKNLIVRSFVVGRKVCLVVLPAAQLLDMLVTGEKYEEHVSANACSCSTKTAFPYFTTQLAGEALVIFFN